MTKTVAPVARTGQPQAVRAGAQWGAPATWQGARMLIEVERFHSDQDATLSLIRVDGVFVCFGLEDEYRPDKIAGETRILAGFYQVQLRAFGGFHERYARRYPWHRGMLEVLDVPGFEHILIHVGNTDEDTAGCLLVGYGAFAENGDLKVITSARAYRDLYRLVVGAAVRGELAIDYVDLDLDQPSEQVASFLRDR